MKYALTQELRATRRSEESILNRVLLQALGDPACPPAVQARIQQLQAAGQPIVLDLDFKIEGHAVDLGLWLGHLMTQFDGEVQRGALRLLEDRFAQLDGQVAVVSDALRVAQQAVLREFGVDPED
jgi:hypothetical protein